MSAIESLPFSENALLRSLEDGSDLDLYILEAQQKIAALFDSVEIDEKEALALDIELVMAVLKSVSHSSLEDVFMLNAADLVSIAEIEPEGVEEDIIFDDPSDQNHQEDPNKMAVWEQMQPTHLVMSEEAIAMRVNICAQEPRVALLKDRAENVLNLDDFR